MSTFFLSKVTVLFVANRTVYGPVGQDNSLRLPPVSVFSKVSVYTVSGSVAALSTADGQCKSDHPAALLSKIGPFLSKSPMHLFCAAVQLYQALFVT